MLEAEYEAQVEEFTRQRCALFNKIADCDPPAAESHRREWHLRSLCDCIEDVKTTISACAHQADEKRILLDRLIAERERCEATVHKMREDLNMLEAISGLSSTPLGQVCSADKREIESLEQQFEEDDRKYLQEGLQQPEPQILEVNTDFEANVRALIVSLQDLTQLSFERRAARARLWHEKRQNSAALAAELEEGENVVLRHERAMEEQRKRVEDSAEAMKQKILDQAKALKAEHKAGHAERGIGGHGERGIGGAPPGSPRGAAVAASSRGGKRPARAVPGAAAVKRSTSPVEQVAQLEHKVAALTDQERRLELRLRGLISRNRSLKEGYDAKVKELADAFRRIESRVVLIRDHQRVGDPVLQNYKLLVENESREIMGTLEEIREDLAAYKVQYPGR